MWCNNDSASDSPLKRSEESDKYGGCRPWRFLKPPKSDDPLQLRDPKGKQCLICFNVWTASAP